MQEPFQWLRRSPLFLRKPFLRSRSSTHGTSGARTSMVPSLLGPNRHGARQPCGRREHLTRPLIPWQPLAVPVAIAQDTEADFDPDPLRPANTSNPRATLRSLPSPLVTALCLTSASPQSKL